MSALTVEQAPTNDLLAEMKRRCSTLNGSQKRIVLLGPPGCGKGTQSEWMKKDLRLVHLSTGDMLRQAVAAKTPLGVEAKRVMDAGGLVSDDVVLGLVRNKFQELSTDPNFRGFILDGFPRTVVQAEGLDKILSDAGVELNAVFNFTLDGDLLKRRLCGRRIHPGSGRTYHVEFRPPKVQGIDDVTGEPLIQRADDCEHSFDTRMKLYKQATEPLIDYYQKKGKLFRVDASQTPEAVRSDVETLFQIGDANFFAANRKAATTTTAPDLTTTASS